MRILVTGGAGFIGSNLVEALLDHKQVRHVRVLDNLSTGHLRNIEAFRSRPNLEFIEGDIRDANACLKACEDIDLISHQAALGSVPRSVEDPLITNAVNITGTLNIFHAAVQKNIKRVVFAASSSTYGDSEGLPKVEDRIGNPLSPYAVTKLVNELYAEVFSKTYAFEYIGLRYFNVFGPRQDSNGAYAAVIPLFMKAALTNIAPTINGDGSYSRDFTFIENVVHANLRALFCDLPPAINQVYNIAYGERTTLNQLWQYIKTITGTVVEANHRENRIGDIPHSLADITKAKTLLSYNPTVDVKSGLEKACKWYQQNGRSN